MPAGAFIVLLAGVTTPDRCPSGEYVKDYIKCDGISDCSDNSDESNAECGREKQEIIYDTIRVLPPVIIDFDGRGNFTLVAMESDTAPCPVTHFRCPGQSVYCMPVYLRCNGVKDCPGGEDELNCANFICPWFYRCRSSILCLHPSHLCDGWPQCPQRDDELNCNENCPSVCQCQGLAFVCPQPFPAHNFSNMRYLDAEGSAIAPSALLHNFYLIYLSLADCGMDTWPASVFPNLQRLDLSYNMMHVYTGLHDLASIHASTFILCCGSLLPEHFNEKFCFAPQDEISSCDDLLRSNLYRVCLWIISIMSMVGNTCSLVFRLGCQRRSIGKSGYNMFVTNLSVVDLVMGVYLAMVGTADQLYRDNYAWNKTAWKSSVTCTVAGFLSLLSSEVSAFMICLITLDRFIVLHFPFSSVRFKGRSAVVASGLAWLGGVLLAAVPLMPSLSHWRFYGQTGICIPLPVTRNTFQGRDYSFGVMIVFNFILFIAIVCGQAVIYWSIRANSMASQVTTDNSRDLKVARRLITVVVSDFLCWFPIGLLGLLASNGVPVPGEVNVALAIFVLPLNSALNPFLYTINILLEKRQRAKEERLRKFLLSSRINANLA
ncbi:G-protein coupled receptor GRL101-like [Littorina saxatilis]|uniref:G-protein coupled receptor GRL101-like n=1 Tax=Littorina saxatilis TaxID=31220 RepID=UPI0038B5EF93